MTQNAAPKTEAAKTEAPAVARKGRQVSTTVPAEYFDGLEEYRWSARLTPSELVREALDAYVADKGIKIDGSAPHAK